MQENHESLKKNHLNFGVKLKFKICNTKFLFHVHPEPTALSAMWCAHFLSTVIFLKRHVRKGSERLKLRSNKMYYCTDTKRMSTKKIKITRCTQKFSGSPVHSYVANNTSRFRKEISFATVGWSCNWGRFIWPREQSRRVCHWHSEGAYGF